MKRCVVFFTSSSCLQPHPHTGAWVYVKHKGWCYRALRVVGSEARAGAPVSKAYKPEKGEAIKAAYKLGHSAGWEATISSSSPHHAERHKAAIARLGLSGDKRHAVLNLPRSPRSRPVEPKHNTPEDRDAHIVRPKGRLPPQLRHKAKK